MAQSFNLPPKEQAADYIHALLHRVGDLLKSAEKVCDEDLRTAFFLATLALEEVIQSYFIWSYGVELMDKDKIIDLLAKKNKHQIRQQFAVAVFRFLEAAKPRLHKIKRKKSHYQAMKFAGDTVREIWHKSGDDFRLENLPHWDKLKQQCMYVDWDPSKGIVKNPVTRQQFDDVVKATKALRAQITQFTNREVRRTIFRHQREFQKIIQDIVKNSRDEPDGAS